MRVPALPLTLCLALFSALFAVPTAIADWQPDSALLPPVLNGATEFGTSVAISGDRAAVGSPQDAPSGAVYVYARGADGWVQETRLTAADADSSDEFGAAVSLHGDLLVVGAPLDDQGGNTAGAAYVFRYSAALGWVQEAKLLAADAQSFDNFGQSVAAGDGWALIGAPREDQGGNDAGAAYFYQWDGAQWLQRSKLLAAGGRTGDQYGFSVCLSSGVALVGSPRDDERGRDTGAVYVYGFDGAAWALDTKLIAENGGGVDDQFGSALAASGAALLIGASRHNTGSRIDTGAAYVFRNDGVVWAQEAMLVGPNAAASDSFGAAVAMDGDLALIGASGRDENAVNSGAVYLFQHSGGDWSLSQTLLFDRAGPLDQLGRAVAVDGQRAVAGLPFSDLAGLDAGAVAAYEFNDPPSCSAGQGYSVECVPAGMDVALDGTLSSDPEQDALTFAWSTDCPNAVFDDAESPTPFLLMAGSADCQGDCRVMLAVSDGMNPPVACETIVTVHDSSPPLVSGQASLHLPASEFRNLASAGTPQVSDCDPNPDLSYADVAAESECTGDPLFQTIDRTWTATDRCGLATPFQQQIQIDKPVLSMDIKPEDCPNRHDRSAGGGLTVVLLGASGLGVSSLDPASLRLSRGDCVGGQVAPQPDSGERIAQFRDAGRPLGDEACRCHSTSPDGLMDLVVEFDPAEMNSALDLSSLPVNSELELVLTGVVNDPASPYHGMPFVARDCLTLVESQRGDDGGDDDDEPPFPLPCGFGGIFWMTCTLAGIGLMRRLRG